MARKANLFLTFIILLTSTLSCSRTTGVTEKVTDLLSDKKVLTVAMDIDMPGYFAVEGEDFGYQYDLLKAYADHLGVPLEITSGSTPYEIREMLEAGTADIVAGLPDHLDGEAIVPLYTTQYVILARQKDIGRNITASVPPVNIMEDKKVMISAGFKTTKSWDVLLDSLKAESVFVSSRNGLELIEPLRSGQYDFLICEKSEAQLGTALAREITEIYEFDEKIPVHIALSGKVDGLEKNFNEWLAHYRLGAEYARLNYIYFEKGLVGQLVTTPAVKKHYKGAISEYDLIMREVCAKEGYDWRLLSAIAYNESRFKADVQSPRGARGLMQIMPATARQFNVDPEESIKPEVNIMLAAKLLGKIESVLKLPKDTPFTDKMSIILACYNCGIGHVLDARRLAVKYEGNPNSWNDVSYFLTRKAEPEFVSDDAVKCGAFKGSKQTLAFVSNVMGRYDAYCSTVNP